MERAQMDRANHDHLEDLRHLDGVCYDRKWVFILEGIPAVILGFVTIFYLTDRPHQAKWMPEDERNWLTEELERERQEKKKARPLGVWQALRQREVVILLSIYFLTMNAGYGFIFGYRRS